MSEIHNNRLVWTVKKKKWNLKCISGHSCCLPTSSTALRWKSILKISRRHQPPFDFADWLYICVYTHGSNESSSRRQHHHVLGPNVCNVSTITTVTRSNHKESNSNFPDFRCMQAHYISNQLDCKGIAVTDLPTPSTRWHGPGAWLKMWIGSLDGV